MYGFTDGESESLWYKYAVSIINIYRSIAGASKHCLQRNPKIIRDMNLFGSLIRLINVLEPGDIQGLRPNTVRTITMYESQWCDDVAIVEHVKYNHSERN